MRRCLGTAVLAIRASGDEQFERIEWILARVHGPHATINLCPEASGCFNKPTVERLVGQRNIIFR